MTASRTTDGFTIAFVGDCILSRPVSQLAGRDPAFAGVLDLLARADVVCGNLETVIFDPRSQGCHPYPWDGDWTLAAEPSVAADLAAMNIRLVSRANNHALDWGTEGMRATSALLDEAGVVHAGAGGNEASARATRYLETPAGRVGLASFATTFRPFSDALGPHEEAPGRPGVSPVALTRIATLPGDLFDDLAGVTGRLGAPVEGDSFQLFGQRIERAAADGGEPSSPGYRYEPCEDHLRAELRAVRLGSQHSDYLVATLHSHEAAAEATPTEPAAIVGELGRKAIDAGSGAFVTTGIHRLGPVEIYRGRPVFHGMGNFFWSDIQQPLPGELYRVHRDLLAGASLDEVTDADLSSLLNAASFDHPWVFESAVAQCRYDYDGGLAELLLHPVELGRGRGLTTSGIPRLAGAEQGRDIIERLAESSAPFGTRIEWTGAAGRVKL